MCVLPTGLTPDCSQTPSQLPEQFIKQAYMTWGRSCAFPGVLHEVLAASLCIVKIHVFIY